MADTKPQPILSELPDAPGVYKFFNSENELIYIGKATSLKNRVKSYFQGQKTPRPIEEMIHEVQDIKWETTDSVIEAIILEANLIKKNKPKYNVLGRDDKSWNFIAITKDKFPKVETIRQHDLNELTPKERKRFASLFGPYPGLNTKAALKILRELFTYSTCEPNQEKPCFYRQIHLCLGVCTNEISPADYKEKVIKPLKLFLGGKKKALIKSLEKQMKDFSKQENFEEAKRLRDQIYNLQTIQDIALLNKDFFQDTSTLVPEKSIRIEGYDISNLGETGKVGSLVVFDQNGPVKSDYKRFKIRTVEGQSDVDCLKEVLNRRLRHDEWKLPDIFLIDGGRPQVNAVVEVLKGYSIRIPVVGIAKGAERKKNEFFIELADEAQKQIIWKHDLLLIRARDEAHRFAINYQRNLRKI